jgi:hypothetical protein
MPRVAPSTPRRLPLTENVVKLPHVSRRANAILGPINGLVVDG